VIELITPRVIAALEPRRKVEITLTRQDGKKHKVTAPTHIMFEKLLRAAGVRLPNGYVPGIFLQGEASSGKTTGAKMLAEVLGLKWYFNGAISFPHEMLGFIDGAGKYHRTPFRDAYEFGGVYTFDEVDRSDPVALLAVNPHLANGIATFPDKQIKRHKDCIIICTANTWGLGADANYSGATKLDGAFLSRFPNKINWDIDPDLEDKIVDHAEWLVRVRAARARARSAGLKVMIDTRVAQAGAALINQAGFTLDEAASITYLANLKPEQRQQVEGN
jgi:cobaltochelatase CobS